jgi:hypothetical protein
LEAAEMTILSDKKQKAAKRRSCWYCGESIEIGETHGYRTGVDGGDFWTMRFHPECDAYACENWDAEDWEGHESSEFKRPMDAFDPCI